MLLRLPETMGQVNASTKSKQLLKEASKFVYFVFSKRNYEPLKLMYHLIIIYVEY